LFFFVLLPVSLDLFIALSVFSNIYYFHKAKLDHRSTLTSQSSILKITRYNGFVWLHYNNIAEFGQHSKVWLLLLSKPKTEYTSNVNKINLLSFCR
jgi:hypothetical protein